MKKSLEIWQFLTKAKHEDNIQPKPYQNTIFEKLPIWSFSVKSSHIEFWRFKSLRLHCGTTATRTQKHNTRSFNIHSSTFDIVNYFFFNPTVSNSSLCRIPNKARLFIVNDPIKVQIFEIIFRSYNFFQAIAHLRFAICKIVSLTFL